MKEVKLFNININNIVIFIFFISFFISVLFSFCRYVLLSDFEFFIEDEEVTGSLDSVKSLYQNE